MVVYLDDIGGIVDHHSFLFINNTKAAFV